MRQGLAWVAVVAGIGLVIGVVALVGWRDDRDEPVAAIEWADGVCGAVAVWRGQLESIVDEFRTPGQPSADATREEQRGSIRLALERTVSATDTLAEGIENAGVPDTPEGGQAADAVQQWADSAHDDLEDSLEALEDAEDDAGATVEAIAAATRTVAGTLAGGVQALAEAVRTDPELLAAFRDAESCAQVGREGER
jgi:hypothetical protein